MNRIENITLINTGGTFNKFYDPISGELIVDNQAKAIKSIAKASKCKLNIITPFAKDSLDMDQSDRQKIVKIIKNQDNKKILIIHGTDTIDKSAKYLDNHLKKYQIVLTGAMTPFSIDPIEATANLALAMGYLLGNDKKGVFIAMHSLILPYKNIIKDRERGIFIRI